LHAFDEAMQRPGVWLVRFADDFVVLARHRKLVLGARKWARWQLKRLKLTMHPQKTRITNFNEGFQFVGWFFIRDEAYELK